MKRLISMALLTATLVSGVVLAAQDRHDHGQTKQDITANCTMMGKHGQRDQDAKGHERMAQMHERMAAKHGESSKDGEHAMHGVQRSNDGRDCPMNGERKPS